MAELERILESLRKSSEDLRSKSLYLPFDPNCLAVKSLLDLESKSTAVFARSPDLVNLAALLAHLVSLINKLKASQSYSVRSFVYRRLIEYQIYGVAVSIEREIRVWFDCEIVRTLVRVLQDSAAEDERLSALVEFERRISMGFDKDLQDLIIREKVFPLLESTICDETSCSPTVRENAAVAIAALAHFNKNVFVGLILMGSTIRALVTLGTSKSIHALCALIRLIRGHLVDEMELDGEIPRIISKLSSEDARIRAMALECVLEIGYFGRRSVVETLLECGLVEKLVYLQRSEVEDEGEGFEEGEEVDGGRRLDDGFLGCIARFAVQVEVGEGTEKREKKAVKAEILRRAREAAVSEAEAAAIVAEVLWGSSP